MRVCSLAVLNFDLRILCFTGLRIEDIGAGAFPVETEQPHLAESVSQSWEMAATISERIHKLKIGRPKRMTGGGAQENK